MLPGPELLDLDLGIALAVAVVAGLMRGFAGFGSAMLMSPIFAILFGPAEMVALIMLMEIGVTVQLLPGAFREAEWRFVGPMGVVAGLAMPVGVWVLLTADTELLTRGVAAIVTLFVLVLMTGWRYRGAKRLDVSLAIGAVSGAMMATTSVGGPPVLLYMLSGPDRAVTNRANIISYFGLTELFLLAVMFANAVVGWSAVWRAALLTPPFMAAAWLGARLFRSSDERHYRRIALAFLLAVGLYGLLR